jgi:hypothetical protein
LPNLSRVSRSFRDLAAAQLYRTLSHVFSENDRGSGRPSIDHLAAALETLTSSDYNYARFIKEISIDTASAISSTDRSRDSKFEYISSKLLNALLLAALKRTVALETFRYVRSWKLH